jgi:hypothetical protein
MEDHLRDRIVRQLEKIPDDQAYKILDYVEFLGSKYSDRSTPDNIFTRIQDKVEDTMRAAKAPVDAISGTVNLFDGATKVMKGVASAAQSVVEEASKAVKSDSEESEDSEKRS